MASCAGDRPTRSRRAAHVVSSPYDPDAHAARKGSTSWVGYKAHLTETCDDELPHLITHVETTPAPTVDGEVTAKSHQGLHATALLPRTHIVDTGYVDADLLVASRRDDGIDRLGPTRSAVHWHARAAQPGRHVDASPCTIDWRARQATCPEGRRSTSWTSARDGRTPGLIKITCAATDCGACPSREQCTQSRRPRRTRTIRPDAQDQALQAARARAMTDAFTADDARRAGVEGTLSQGVRRCGLRRARYRGQPKTHLHQLLIATAMNDVRLGVWLRGTPHAKTQRAAFLRLLAPAG